MFFQTSWWVIYALVYLFEHKSHPVVFVRLALFRREKVRHDLKIKMADFVTKKKTDWSGSGRSWQWTCDNLFIVRVWETSISSSRILFLGQQRAVLLFVNESKTAFAVLLLQRTTCSLAVPLANMVSRSCDKESTRHAAKACSSKQKERGGSEDWGSKAERKTRNTTTAARSDESITFIPYCFIYHTCVLSLLG